MGHIHLLTLPGSKRWREVAALIGEGGAAEAVAAAAARAAEDDLAVAARDAGYLEAIRLLALVPVAARSERFGAELRSLGLAVPDAPGLIDILSAAGRHLDRTTARSDFGELSRRALVGAFNRWIGDALPSLLAPEPSDVRAAARRLSHGSGFAGLARSFFGRLAGETLAYWLDRKLSAATGAGLAFEDAAARSGFDRALRQYCSEATRIIREFAPGWLGKTLHREGTVTRKDAAAFGHVAMKKIGEELRRKRDPDA